MNAEIYKPIFIIGSQRSGTSIFFRKMCQHPDLAYFTYTSKKFPRSVLLTRMISPFRHNHDPSEGSKIWGKFASGDDDSLDRSDVNPRARRYFSKAITTQLKVMKKPRFMSKHPRNSVRMTYFHEIFPDAVFIHIVRDGRAVSRSLLQFRLRKGGEDKYRGCRPPGWRRLLIMDPLESCCYQWKMVVQHVRREATKIPKDQYMEVEYQDFMTRPDDVLRNVAKMCDLTWDENHLKSIGNDLNNRDFKWKESFSKDQIERLNAIIEED